MVGVGVKKSTTNFTGEKYEGLVIGTRLQART